MSFLFLFAFMHLFVLFVLVKFYRKKSLKLPPDNLIHYTTLRVSRLLELYETTDWITPFCLLLNLCRRKSGVLLKFALQMIFDNKVVTLASNNLNHEPLQNCSRYCRQKKQKVTILQPYLIRQYNGHMGGVDQLDSYLNNLRPCIGGEKWYWMQLINFVRVMQVAAFRLYSMIHPDEKLFQLGFIRSFVREYIQNKRSTDLFYLIFLGLSHFQWTTILLFCLLKVD